MLLLMTAQATAAAPLVRPFLSHGQMSVMIDACRGEEGKFFMRKFIDLAQQIVDQVTDTKTLLESRYFAADPPRIDLDLQLAQAGAVTTGSSAHRLVQRDAVALSLGVGEENVLAVLVDADETEVLHLYLPGSGQVTLDCAIPGPVDKAAHAGRESRAGAR